jgi:hypothetical protein
MLDNANGLQELSLGTEPRDYSTDVLRRKAAAFIRGTPTGMPFFLMVTPFAPHGPPIALLEEGLAQHEPNCWSEADAHAWSVHGKGRSTYTAAGECFGVDRSISWAVVRLTSTDPATTRRLRCSTSC